MDMSLRNAFIISAIIHVALFAPYYNQNMLRQEIEKRNSAIVDYVILREIANAVTANKEVVLRQIEPPRIEIKKEVEIKPQPTTQGKISYKKRLEAKKLIQIEKARKQYAAKVASREAAVKESELKSKKDYVNYYQLIRDKIKSRLKDNYGYYNHEGDVYLSFAITQNGTLLTYNIDRSRSTTDEVLLHITIMSLKAVSPFPPLPKSIQAPKMSFNVAISFKK